MAAPNQKWNSLRKQFWQAHAEATDDPITEESPRSFPPAERPIPVTDIISHMDTYNIHGCYDYGGTLPLQPLGQVPAVVVKSSIKWRRFYYAQPQAMPCFRTLLKHVESGD